MRRDWPGLLRGRSCRYRPALRTAPGRIDYARIGVRSAIPIPLGRLGLGRHGSAAVRTPVEEQRTRSAVPSLRERESLGVRTARGWIAGRTRPNTTRGREPRPSRGKIRRRCRRRTRARPGTWGPRPSASGTRLRMVSLAPQAALPGGANGRGLFRVRDTRLSRGGGGRHRRHRAGGLPTPTGPITGIISCLNP